MTYLKLQNSYYFVFPIIAWIIIMMRHRSDAWRWIATNKGKLGQLKDLHHTTGRPVLASHLLLSSPSYTSGKSFPFSNSAHTSRLFYTTSAYSFSSSHSSYSNNGEESLTVLDSKRHEEVDPELRMRFSKIKLAMSKCINAEDFVGAKALYDEVIDNIHLGKNVNTVLMFLSMCDKAEHLPAVLSAVESMKKHNIPIIEQCYVSLIRCYADANMVDEVWKVLDLMKTQHIEARLRTLQPVLDSYSKHGDLAGALKVLHYIQDLQLEARPEQITSLLNAYAKARNKFQSHSSTEDVESFKKMKKQVDEILSHASQALFGVSLDDLEQISTTMNNMTVKEVRDIGVLVESIEDIGGPIISDADLVVDGSVVALNATYDNSFTIIDPRTPTPSHRNPYLPLGLKADAIHFIPQKFSVWSEKKKLFIAALKKQSEHVDDPSVGWVKTAKMLDEGQVQTVTKLSEVPEQEMKDKHNLFVGVPDLNWERSLPSRLVHVSSNTCRCPHCGGDILNVQISEKEKKEVCEALLRTAEEHSANQTHHLESFGQWLQSRPEFDFIIDGPNVAYQNQNHDLGRFSYKQIELVVKKLKEMGKRPLVILPSCYSKGRHSIPNSIRKIGAMKRVLLNDEEKKFLHKLDKEGILYTVPNGANDDWYWMYSTIYPGRQNPAFVVTNDLMRDHKVSFLAPLPFVRWRTTQIVYYSIFRHLNYNATHHGFNNATAVLKVKPELRNSTVFEENLPVTVSVEVGSSSNSSNVKEEVSATNKTVVGSKPKGKNPIVEACIPPFNDMEGDGEVFLFGPGNFSREIQRSTFTDRWHIPASDSNLWLCLNTEERVARRNSSIPKHVHISSMDIHSNNEINSGSGIMV